jgi:hypothetical protein
MLCLENPHTTFQQKSSVKQVPHHALCLQPMVQNSKLCHNPLCQYPLTLAPKTRITDVEPRALATEQGICLTLELSLLKYDPSLPIPDVFYIEEYTNPCKHGPVLLMQCPTQHLMPKIPVFNFKAVSISANCGQYLQ